MSPSTWQDAAAGARLSVEKSIPQRWLLPKHLLERAEIGALKPSECEGRDVGILDDRDRWITEIAAIDELQHHLRQGVFSAVEVTTAFCKRAAIAHQCTSCLTCFFPEEALHRAKELDECFKATGETAGPLHGIPISFKDSFDIAGRPSSIGLISWLGNIATTDSLCVKPLVDAGGVLFAKTGTSQACLMVESINNIFGAIRNPFNPALNPGGSSGGEFRLGILGLEQY